MAKGKGGVRSNVAGSGKQLFSSVKREQDEGNVITYSYYDIERGRSFTNEIDKRNLYLYENSMPGANATLDEIAKHTDSEGKKVIKGIKKEMVDYVEGVKQRVEKARIEREARKKERLREEQRARAKAKREKAKLYNS